MALVNHNTSEVSSSIHTVGMWVYSPTAAVSNGNGSVPNYFLYTWANSTASYLPANEDVLTVLLFGAGVFSLGDGILNFTNYSSIDTGISAVDQIRDEWHHAVLMLSASTVTLWYDGTKYGPDASADIVRHTPKAIEMCNYFNLYPSPVLVLIGHLDALAEGMKVFDLRHYSREITYDEVQAWYSGTLDDPTSVDGLFLNMFTGQGTSRDVSGNSNDMEFIAEPLLLEAATVASFSGSTSVSGAIAGVIYSSPAGANLVQSSGDADVGDTVKIGSITYTYASAPFTEPYQVADESGKGKFTNLIRAIKASGAIGVSFSSGTVAHPDFTAGSIGILSSNAMYIHAKTVGTGSNGVVLETTIPNASWHTDRTYGGYSSASLGSIKFVEMSPHE